MTQGLYIWKDGKPEPAASLKEWCIFLECYERRVLFTKIGPVHVSTVFLGIDHAFVSDVPILFETMLFHDESLPAMHPGLWADNMSRYRTLEEAKRGHGVFVEKVREFHPDAEVQTLEFKMGELMEGMAGKEQDIRLGWPLGQ